MKLIRAKETWIFLKECKLNRVLPMSIYRITLPISSRKILTNTKRICFKFALADAKRRFYRIKSILEDLLQENDASADELLFRRISDFNNKMSSFQNALRRKHIKKLKWIFRRQLHSKKNACMPLDDVITILDDIQLPQFAAEVFSKGPSCALLDTCNITNDIPVFERMVEPMDVLGAEKQRWSFVNELSNKKKRSREPPMDSFALNDIRVRQTLDWLNYEGLTMTREDKSKKVVLLKKSSYDLHIMKFIQDSNAEILPKDPTLALSAKINKLLRHNNLPNYICRSKIVNPACPRIFAYIKTHKNPIAARPIVEKMHSPMYNIEKSLAKWCHAFLTPYPMVVSSPTEFLGKLIQLRPTSENEMTVLDFESLYPSLDLNATCLLFYRFLIQHTSMHHQDLSLLREIAYTICHDSFFEYNGLYYRQLHGVPIGSPMAGVLAELVVREVESQLSSKLTEEMLLYSRYVDDLFILWHSKHRAHDVIQQLSKKEYGLTLKLTEVSQGVINFLDIKIIASEGTFITTVYTKPTTTPVIIPRWSFDPWTYKKNPP